MEIRNNNRETRNSGSTTVEKITQNSIRIVTEVKEEHIPCDLLNFRMGKFKFLMDTGAQMNIIEMSVLGGKVVVNESDKRNIKGINEIPISMIGTVRTPTNIQGAVLVIEFDVVNEKSLIPEAGIIGRLFLKENQVYWDFSKDTLTLPKNIGSGEIIIPRRSNCVMLRKSTTV